MLDRGEREDEHCDQYKEDRSADKSMPAIEGDHDRATHNAQCRGWNCTGTQLAWQLIGSDGVVTRTRAPPLVSSLPLLIN